MKMKMLKNRAYVEYAKVEKVIAMTMTMMQLHMMRKL
jgi:hypothetical protein